MTVAYWAQWPEERDELITGANRNEPVLDETNNPDGAYEDRICPNERHDIYSILGLSRRDFL